jgi:nucleoside-diphosphate-sugar epimerase
MSLRVGVVGAGGFVGSRLVEQAVLLGKPDLVPIIRSYRSLGRVARFGVACRMGDATRLESIGPAIAGCDAVVNVSLGETEQIETVVATLFEACRQQRVPLLIHVSSAEVYGRADQPGLNDDSPPDLRHWMPYARAKGRAENWLRSRLDNGQVRIVVLRPGLIWGPRSSWVAGPAKLILENTAFLVGNGEGICNLIYVDNLVSCVMAVAEAAGRVEGFFNVGDEETVTWRQYYEALAAQMGIPKPAFHRVPDAPPGRTLVDHARGLLGTAPSRWIKGHLRGQTKARLRRWVLRLAGKEKRSGVLAAPGPQVTKPLWWLQGTRSKLAADKFRRAYPGTPLIPFAQAMRQTGEWLRFGGFGG